MAQQSHRAADLAARNLGKGTSDDNSAAACRLYRAESMRTSECIETEIGERRPLPNGVNGDGEDRPIANGEIGREAAPITNGVNGVGEGPPIANGEFGGEAAPITNGVNGVGEGSAIANGEIRERATSKPRR